jgi:hypothetical protein
MVWLAVQVLPEFHSPDPQVTLHELGQQIGSDRVNVTIGAETPAARPYTRTYTSLSDIAREVDLSRILAGVVSGPTYRSWRRCCLLFLMRSVGDLCRYYTCCS